MKSELIKNLKIPLILISAVFVVLWGLFYFTNNSQNNLVSENITEEENVLVLEEDKGDDLNNKEEIFKENNLEDNISKKVQVSEGIKVGKMEKKEIVEEYIDNKNNKEEGFNDKINNKLISWGFTPSLGREIDTIVIHSSYNALGGDEYDLDKLIAIYKEYGVAAHYLIDREGDIYRLVEDNNIAYHAGISNVPDGRTNVNNFSIGIEIMNTKTDDYEKEQYEAANWLIEKIEKDYNIKYILGHSEIAPDRKTDPWNINWDKVNR